MKRDLSAIILCGGRSRRMGADKATLDWMGQPMIRHIIDNLQEADELLLAVGSQRSESLRDFRQALDRFPGGGPLAGIHAGLLECRHDVAFVTGCDLPFADLETAGFLRSLMKPGDDAVIPAESGGRVHPLCALYHRQIAPRLEEKLRVGSCRVMDALRELSVRYVPADTLPNGGRELVNLNTPDEYQNALGAANAKHL